MTAEQLALVELGIRFTIIVGGLFAVHAIVLLWASIQARKTGRRS